MKFTVLALMVSVSINAAAFEPNKIIGEDDLVVVNADGSNIPFKYKKLINAFGLMVNMGCTATHIGNGYVLTAGHCFWADPDISEDLPCADTTIEWGVREGISAYLTSTCEKIVFSVRDAANDFAIIKVSPVPDAAIEVDLERKAAPGDTITIFSHPEELPLRWSKTCVVESKLDSVFSPDTLQHKCDTKAGSSGAAVIDTTTGKVVGIHDGGRFSSPADGMNYGTFLTNLIIADALKKLGFN